MKALRYALTAGDLELARAEGGRRQRANEARGRVGRNGAPSTGPEAWARHLLGVKGEIAVARALGFGRHHLYRNAHPVEGSADLPGRIDVKTRTSRHHALLVGAHEDDAKRFVLATLEPGEIVTIDGWIPGLEAKRGEWWAEKVPGRPCYFVPAGALHPMDSLQHRLAAEGNGPTMTFEKIARVAHEANRGYCAAIGDSPQPEWDAAPDWQKQSALNGVIFHSQNPEADDAASHANWMKVKEAEGWTYGPTKDPEARTHPCLVPFDRLPPDQRRKDRLFRLICRALLEE